MQLLSKTPARIFPIQISKSSITQNQFLKNKITIKTKTKIEIIAFTQINYLEASSNYTYVHLIDGTKKLVSKCLKEMTKQLDMSTFFKSHQSYVINLNYLSAYYQVENKVELTGGIKLSVSRVNKKKLVELLK